MIIIRINKRQKECDYNGDVSHPIITLGRNAIPASFNHELAHYTRNRDGIAPDIILWFPTQRTLDKRVFWEEVECWKQAVLNLSESEREETMRLIRYSLESYAKVTDFIVENDIECDADARLKRGL